MAPGSKVVGCANFAREESGTQTTQTKTTNYYETTKLLDFKKKEVERRKGRKKKVRNEESLFSI